MTPDLKWLTDPTVFAVNRLDAPRTMFATAARRRSDLSGSSLRQSLDGRWRFAYHSACPAAQPADFYPRGRGSLCLRHDLRPRASSCRAMARSSTPTPLPVGRPRCARRRSTGTTSPSAAITASSISVRGCAGSVCVSFQGARQALYVWSTAASSATPRTALPPRNLT